MPGRSSRREYPRGRGHNQPEPGMQSSGAKPPSELHDPRACDMDDAGLADLPHAAARAGMRVAV